MGEGTGQGGGAPSVPVVAVGPEPRPGDAGAAGAALVVGFDRSAASLAALATGGELGRRLGAELHVVHAVDLADYPVDPDADDWEGQAATTLQAQRRSVDEALAGYPHRWRYLAVRAEPADALVWAADRCDALMIVVGAHSTGWRRLLDRLSGPSVSERLLGHCHRPVLVVGAPRGGHGSDGGQRHSGRGGGQGPGDRDGGVDPGGSQVSLLE